MHAAVWPSNPAHKLTRSAAARFLSNHTRTHTVTLCVCVILWPTQQQVNGSIIDADATLFEVGRRLKCLSQCKEKKLSQKGKKNGMEGKRATARSEVGQEGKVHRQHENIIL